MHEGHDLRRVLICTWRSVAPVRKIELLARNGSRRRSVRLARLTIFILNGLSWSRCGDVFGKSNRCCFRGACTLLRQDAWHTQKAKQVGSSAQSPVDLSWASATCSHPLTISHRPVSWLVGDIPFLFPAPTRCPPSRRTPRRLVKSDQPPPSTILRMRHDDIRPD